MHRAIKGSEKGKGRIWHQGYIHWNESSAVIIFYSVWFGNHYCTNFCVNPKWSQIFMLMVSQIVELYKRVNTFKGGNMKQCRFKYPNIFHILDITIFTTYDADSISQHELAGVILSSIKQRSAVFFSTPMFTVETVMSASPIILTCWGLPFL